MTTSRRPSQPGLDLTQLRALRTPHAAVAQLPDRIRTHLAAHDGYLAFSGGKDSLATLHLTLQAEPNVPVVFFDSGLEFPETYTYLARLQDQLDIDIDWIHARHTTLEILRRSGAWDHHQQRAAVPDLHQVLITEPSSRAHARHGAGEIWGVRAQESRGRAALYANALRAETSRSCSGCCTSTTERRRRHGGLVRRVDGTVALGPIWDWKTDQVWAYLARHQLPVNPVYDKLRLLGAPEHFLRVSHMLDGSRLEEGRVTWLRRGWPDLFEELATHLPRLREFV
jgi:phosphoadenosine phosphosulfate reductase